MYIVFRLTKRDVIFETILTTFDGINIFEAAGELVKIGSSLKSNHHNQVKLVLIHNTHRIRELDLILAKEARRRILSHF